MNIYEPEQLKTMRPDAITALINRDIHEDAYARQEKELTRFRSKRRAERLESALFICPECGRVGTLRSSGAELSCECGLKLEYTEQGMFSPEKPFRTVREWDIWQTKALRDGEYPRSGEDFGDDDVRFVEVMADHSERAICDGRLSLVDGVLRIGSEKLPLAEISDMAIVRTNRLIFTMDGRYYELKASLDKCMRKYLLVWQNLRGE